MAGRRIDGGGGGVLTTMLAATASNAATTKAYWYLTRSSGVVTLVMLTLSVAFGIAQVTRWASPRWPRFVIAGLHRNVSLAVVVFLALHIVTAVLDSFAPIRWLDAFVPFQGQYRPLWLGFGALACDLVIALVVTSLVRTRMGYRSWRAVHWLAYASWPVALVHGLGTGSDTHQHWMLFVDAICVAIVVAALLWRISISTGVTSSRRMASVAATIAVLLAMFVWTAAGPLHKGWARRAGTPVSLLSSKRVAAVARPVVEVPTTATTKPRARTRTTTPTVNVPIAARYDATLTETNPDGNNNAVVVIDGNLRDGARDRLHIALSGRAIDDGGIQMEQSRVYLGPISTPSLYEGSVTSLSGTHIEAQLHDAASHQVDVTVDLRITDNGASVHGDVQVVKAGG